MDGKYFIFDMDETLAELYSVYYFIATLRLSNISSDDIVNIPNSLYNSLNRGYKKFVREILREEISNKLGILRPGVLNVMMKLSELQKIGKIKNVIIYSNNGHLESLEFIRDLIHKYVNNNELIKECIHWNHPMRGNEVLGQVGATNKTWGVLRNILIKGNCKASNKIEPSNIYFFDDLDHTDLKINLGENYYQVPGYSFKSSFNRIANIFRKSLIDMKLNDTYILNDMIIKVFGDYSNFENINEDGIDNIIKIFSMKTKNTVNNNVLPPSGQDKGIDMMYDAINKINMSNGGKRNKNSTKKRREKKYSMKTLKIKN